MEELGNNSQLFHLKFRRNFHNDYLAYKMLTSARKIYRLQRKQKRLRVSCIGYSYIVESIH